MNLKRFLFYIKIKFTQLVKIKETYYLINGNLQNILLKIEWKFYDKIYFIKHINMKKTNLMTTAFLLITQLVCSQIQNQAIQSVYINGNCSMCKSRIEKSLNKKKISKGVWDESTKIANITYDKDKITLQEILKKVALAGYDNDQFLAPVEAYNMLPECCQYKRRTPNSITSQKNKLEASQVTFSKTETLNSPKIKDTVLNQQEESIQLVFKSYFELKDALVNSSGSKASQKSSDFLNVLKAVIITNLKMELQAKWLKSEADLSRDALLISKTQELDQQRKYFISLSSNMYTVLKDFRPTEPVYYQFCPMANDGIGANWLSKDLIIKNPYYGNKMLSCGKTIETINP